MADETRSRLGRGLASLRLHPEDRDRVWGNVERAIATLEPFVFEERIVRPNGEERTLLSQGHVVTGPEGTAVALVGVCHDVTERTRAERDLGTSQRRMRAIVDNSPSIVAVKDLEGRFLMANAELGRLLALDPNELVGQGCFELFPEELAEQLRANDLRAATEGEAVYDEAVLYDRGEPRNYLTVTFSLPDDDGRPIETCTIGTDVTETRERASERRQRRDWEARIGAALREDRIVAYAQPVVDLATGERVSCELLVRMIVDDDAGTVLSPAAFLPAAERFGLIREIDLWMVREALRLAPEVNPEVNLSGVSLSDAVVRREIVALLEAAPPEARTLVFEITETAAVEHLDAARAFAEEVTALGCALALDDFGTGFGSLHLPAQPAAALPEDRHRLRGRAALLRGRRARRREHDRHRRPLRPPDDRRGRRGRGDARPPARDGHRPRAGLPPGPPGAARGDQVGCAVGRIRISLTSTCGGWVTANITARAMSSASSGSIGRSGCRRTACRPCPARSA